MATARRAKIGRNDPCPCGSGQKYKKCHGRSSSTNARDEGLNAAIRQFSEKSAALHKRRQDQQGLGRPIISAVINGYRLIAVGSKLHWSKSWKTFHDFLRDYLVILFGREWVSEQQKRPANERHPILRWIEQALDDAGKVAVAIGGIRSAPMTGAARAFLNLSYNLYLIAHHIDRDSEALLERLIKRLKSEPDFQGALYETYVAAAFLKAGFGLQFEDESVSTRSHCEFVATHRLTGNKFSVEAKARNRLGVESSGTAEMDQVRRLRVASKLHEALKKSADHTRVVFIDVNVPDTVTAFEGWAVSAVEQISGAEQRLAISGQPAPSAYVFVSNHPYHHNLSELSSGYAVVVTGFKIPNFGAAVSFPSMKELLRGRSEHCEMHDLMRSLSTHYEIPSTFDGEIPELEFGDGLKRPRLEIGRWYVVPDEEGNEVRGKLYEAIVMEGWKEAVGAYELEDGRHILAKCPMTEEELAAYRRYPDTFFGAVRQKNRKVKDVVELFDFFYESYRDTPKERLLQFMKDASDFDRLREMSQDDLAIAYCERAAVAITSDRNKQSASIDGS